MSNPINIDHNCNQAIRREIGKQLRVYLRVSSRLPARLRKQVDRLDKLEGQSPQAFPKRNMGSKTSLERTHVEEKVRGCRGDENADQRGDLS